MPPKPRASLNDVTSLFAGSVTGRDEFSPEAVENFKVFLREGQFMFDRRLIDPDKFYWLDPVYDITRSDLFGLKTADGVWIQRPRFPNGIVFRKASQMGVSTWAAFFMMWLCIDRSRPLAIGNYWPNEKELQGFVQTRLNPMIDGNEKMKSYIEPGAVNSTEAKQIAGSTIYFRHASGKSANDAVPLDIVIGDEIRLWNDGPDTIQRIKERYGQSDVQLLVLMSTVGSQGDYMEARWEESTQWKYFSVCPDTDCHTEISAETRTPNRLLPGDRLDQADPDRLLVRGVCLSDFLPSQIVAAPSEDGEMSEEEILSIPYHCPSCGGVIPNPRNGRYVETRPHHRGGMFALEFARTLSPRLNPSTLLKEFKNAEDMKQFMNGYMAKPWMDPEGRVVRIEHWRAALTNDFGWAERAQGGRNFAGFDLRARELHWVVGELGEGGNPGRLLRLGVYQGDQWQEHIRMVMREFMIEKAIGDYLPFSTDMLSLANEFEGRLLLAQYKNGERVRTIENENAKGKKKVSHDGRERHMVILDQYKSLHWSLGSFAGGHWRVPDAPLWQSPYLGRLKQKFDAFNVSEGLDGVGREGFKHHLMGLAVVTTEFAARNASKEKVDVSGKQTQIMVDADNFDPHWAHAFNYMATAAGLDGGGMKVMRSPQGTRGVTPASGIPAALRRVPEQSCGACQFCHPGEGYGPCEKFGYEVRPQDPRCNVPGGFRALRR